MRASVLEDSATWRGPTSLTDVDARGAWPSASTNLRSGAAEGSLNGWL
jgi:hypothetical protein